MVTEGVMEMVLQDADGDGTVVRMEPGDCIRITPGQRHRMVAVEDCEFFEVSSPEIDDVVRLEDRYGREGISTG